jgi:hypothetical protein
MGAYGRRINGVEVEGMRSTMQTRRWAWFACMGAQMCSEDTGQAHGPELTRERKWETAARELGRETGKAAGSWAADGNTTEDHARRVLELLEAGDPAADELLPARPNLSGEWADAPTPRWLFEHVTGLDAHAEGSWNADAYQAVLELLCDAWEAGVDETFEDACVAELRGHVS